MSTRFLRRYWLLLVGTPLIAMLAAFAVSKQMTPQYDATATIVVLNLLPGDLVPPENDPLAPYQLPPGLSDLEVEERVLTTYVRLVERESVLEAARASLNFAGSSQELAAKLSVANPTDTQLIEIRAVDADPQRAAMIANTVASQFVATSDEQFGREGLFAIAEAASPAESPFSPNIPINVALAFLVASVAAVSVGLVLERFNRPLSTAADVEDVSELPLLGSIPRAGIRRRWLDAWTSKRPSASADAYRHLRANLLSRGLGSSYRSLYATSQETATGKSVLVSNLGVALANAGRRVVLIDLNLKAPALHRLFSIPNQLGIAEYLSGRVEYETLLKSTSVPRLSLIPAGTVEGDAEDLLARSSPESLVHDLLNEADVVLVDGPALSRSPGAAMLSTSFDATLIVIAGGRTTQADLQHLEERLAAAAMPVMGIVMNRTRAGVSLKHHVPPSMDESDLDVLPERPRLRPARPEQR